ncbi:hypothetical protein AOLI_G00033790 [Acnodon oligacanthus]
MMFFKSNSRKSDVSDTSALQDSKQSVVILAGSLLKKAVGHLKPAHCCFSHRSQTTSEASSTHPPSKQSGVFSDHRKVNRQRPNARPPAALLTQYCKQGVISWAHRRGAVDRRGLLLFPADFPSIVAVTIPRPQPLNNTPQHKPLVIHLRQIRRLSKKLMREK